MTGKGYLVLTNNRGTYNRNNTTHKCKEAELMDICLDFVGMKKHIFTQYSKT